VIWVRREAIYFCTRIWTGQITLIRLDKLAVARKARLTVIARSVARGFALYSIVGATFAVCVCILFSTNEALAHYRAGAWGLLSGIAGAAIAALFGKNILPSQG
jgi:hypothetical protein